MSIKVVYCAGPYRGVTEEDVRRNVERAKWWAEAVWRLGGAAICPHTNTYDMDQAVGPQEFIERDLEIVRRCDAILLLPGWDKSSGAQEELEAMQKAGKNVFFWWDIGDLASWLSKE